MKKILELFEDNSTLNIHTELTELINRLNASKSFWKAGDSKCSI